MALSKSTRILILLGIDSAFFLLELVIGYSVHSLALVADSFHMLNDVISLLVGLWAVKVAGQKTESKRYTYGWQRAETLGALVNGVFLVALCLSIFLEAIQRFVEPQEVSQPKLVLIVGCFGLASNILGLALFHDHSHSHGGHSHGGEHEAHDELSAAESGQGTTVDGDTSAISNEGGNIADILPQSVIAGYSKGVKGPGGSARVQSQEVGRKDDSAAATTTNLPRSIPRKSSSASGTRASQHRSRRSGSHSRYASMGDVPVHLHPASFRNEIIAAARLEEVESATATESEGEDDDANGRRATESSPLLNGSHAKYGNGQIGKKSQKNASNLGHTSHKHRQPKSTEESGGHSHGDLNVRGIFLHVMGDALGNVGVIATALVIWLTDFWWRFYFDPFISLVITVIILLSAIPLCRAASRILLQAVPAGLEIDDIREDIESLEGVVSCHHLHVWQLSDTKIVASLHIQLGFDFEGAGKEEYMRLAKEVRTCLHEYGIHSSTIQPEFCLDEGHDHVTAQFDGSDQAQQKQGQDACLLECGEACTGATCCAPGTTTEDSRSSSVHKRH